MRQAGRYKAESYDETMKKSKSKGKKINRQKEEEENKINCTDVCRPTITKSYIVGKMFFFFFLANSRKTA